MKNDRFYRNLFILFLTLISLGIVYQVRMLLTPVLSALLVAYIFYPIIVAASRIGIPKVVTILIIFLSFLGSIVYVGSTLIPEIKHEVKVLSKPELYKDEAQSRLMNIGKDLSSQLGKLGIIEMQWNDEEIINVVSEWIAEQSTFLLRSIGEFATEAGQFLIIFFFVLVFALLDGDKFYKAFVAMIPNSFFEPGLFILKKTTDLLGYYLRGIVIENIILGIISVFLLSILSFFTSLSFVLVLVISIMIAITNVIRIIGPIIGAVTGILLVLITSTDFIVMLGILAIAIIVQLLDNVLILPLVMKEQVKIHPAFCVIGVLMGGILAGILGMILAIPVIGSLKVIYRILAIEMKKFNMEPEAGVELPRQYS